MRMTKEHYAALDSRVRPFRYALERHIINLKEQGGYKCLETRVLMDAFHACKIFKDYTYQQFDYTDEHIRTAMRAIFKDMGLYSQLTEGATK